MTNNISKVSKSAVEFDGERYIERWGIKGIGINASDILPYIDKSRVADILIANDDNEDDPIAKETMEEIRKMKETGDYTEMDVSQFVSDCGWRNVSSLLAYCDDSHTLCGSWVPNGEEGYFFYESSMPWDRFYNEPSCIEDVHNRIVEAVQQIADMTESQIETLIDDKLDVICWD